MKVSEVLLTTTVIILVVFFVVVAVDVNLFKQRLKKDVDYYSPLYNVTCKDVICAEAKGCNLYNCSDNSKYFMRYQEWEETK